MSTNAASTKRKRINRLLWPLKGKKHDLPLSGERIPYSVGSFEKIYSYITKRQLMLRSSAGAEILHYPRLDTVLMVEEFVREHSGEFKKRQLWEHLPKKMMYQTFCVTLVYLEESGKIAIDREGKVAWIWNPELVRTFLRPELVVR